MKSAKWFLTAGLGLGLTSLGLADKPPAPATAPPTSGTVPASRATNEVRTNDPRTNDVRTNDVRTNDVRTNDVRTNDSSNAATVADQQIAAMLIVDNQGEIDLGRLGEQKAEHKEVKEFATRMIKEHSDFLAKLQKVSSNGSSGATHNNATVEVRTSPPSPGAVVTNNNPNNPNNPNSNNANPNNANPNNPNNPNNIVNNANNAGAAAAARANNPNAPRHAEGAAYQAASISPSGLDPVALKQELGQECLNSKKRELSRQTGNDFDKAFLICQEVGHMEMLDMLKVYRRHASPSFQKTLDEAAQTTQAHLDHCKKVLKDVEGIPHNSAEKRDNAPRSK